MELPESDALFRAVFEQAAVGVALLETATGRYLRVNQCHCDLVGYTREELERLDFQTITHPDDLAPDIALMERVLAGDAPSFTMEKRYIRKDGTIVWVDLTVSPLWKRGDPPDFHVAVVQDISERKRIEYALRESEAKFRTLYNDAPVMLHSMDAAGRIVSVSNRWLEVLGYARDEVVGRSSTDFLTAASRAYAREVVLPRFFASGSVTDVPYQFVKRDGEILDVQLSAVAEVTEDGRFVCSRAALIDVTERKRMEEELRQSQKMESVGRLAGGIAHDFNNLLAVILGNVEMALVMLPPGTPVQRDILEAQRGAQRAASLTQQLLAFSRKQVLQPQTLDLNRVVQTTDSMLRRLIGENIELVCDLAPDLRLTRADPGQLEQVIVNLVLNGRDAMPDGGRLAVTTANADGFVVLSVTDTGTGMDEATCAQVFEPFFTTKAPGKGTGLGLATVYGIVKQSGGEVAVSSEQGRGSRFRVYLPVAAEGAQEPSPTPAVARRATGAETVLVVEDESVVRAIAVRVLETAGYQVLSAGDGAEALRVCAEHEGPVHLALTDVVMPVLGGAVFAAQITALRPELRVLFMSGYAEDAVGHDGKVIGGAFIPKPFSAAELTRRVREVLDATRGSR